MQSRLLLGRTGCPCSPPACVHHSTGAQRARGSSSAQASESPPWSPSSGLKDPNPSRHEGGSWLPFIASPFRDFSECSGVRWRGVELQVEPFGMQPAGFRGRAGGLPRVPWSGLDRAPSSPWAPLPVPRERAEIWWLQCRPGDPQPAPQGAAGGPRGWTWLFGFQLLSVSSSQLSTREPSTAGVNSRAA